MGISSVAPLVSDVSGRIFNIACYVQNKVLVVKPHNKIPYELSHGRTSTLSSIKPYGCPVTILNTLDHLGKFNGKADEGFFVGYSMNSKAFRVFNSRKKILEENLRIRFSENTSNVVGTKSCDNAGQARKEKEHVKDYIFLSLWTANPLFSQDPKSSQDDGFQPSSDSGNKVDEDPSKESESKDQEQNDNVNSTNNVNAASINRVNIVSENISNELPFDPNMPALEDITTFNFSSDHEDDNEEADQNNMYTTIQVSRVPTTRIHKDHHLDQNKKDERGIMIRNKARLVAQGHTQEEEIKYDEVFVPVAKIKAIRLFLAYASFKYFVVYQMDVKSAFLYRKIEEEVYVCQPPGFKDPDFPDKQYKVKKELYGLHQAPRAWFTEVKNVSTLIETQKPLLKDKDGEEVDVHMYRSMIGSLMIFMYLKGQPKFGLWYPKDSSFDLVAYTDSDYAKESLDRKSTTGGITYYYCSKLMLLGSAMPTGLQHTPTLLQPSSSQPQKTQKPRKAKRKKTQVPQLSGLTESVADKAVYKELNDSLVRASTTTSILNAEQDSGNINKTQSKATPNESSFQGTDSSGGPKCQKVMRDTITQTRSERVSKLSNDSLLARGNTLQSDEDRLKLNELMKLCTTLQSRVLDLEKTKTTQALEIDNLKRRVKKLEKKQRSRTHKLKRLYKVGLTARVESSDDNEDLDEDASKQGRISDIDADEEVFVSKQDENVVEKEVDAGQVQVSTAATTATISIDEVTLAQALAELKNIKPKAKAKWIVFHEPEESTTTTTATIPKPKSQDKCKSIMIEEPVKLKKKDQIMLDEEVALKLQAELQAEFDKEEQRLARESAQKELEVNEKRRKFFTAKATKEKRNKPPTQAQQRKIMCTYLKNMKGKKLKDLKNKSFDSIQKMFDKVFKRVNTFEPLILELVKGRSKRAGTELEQESFKKQKIDDDKQIAELKQLVKIIPDEEGVAIDAIPLAVKLPSIID
uniref:Uncharacterized protein n=1 Tax=Tanacetum cinerariifolium TaxID=118510 RepID=A0A6L2JYM4_TANCI|nr:hypothetical protein [Tanacetum cinerariifolium]